MAMEAAALIHRVMRVNALAYYMEELFVGYANLYRDASRVPALLRRLRRNGSVARVECDEHGGEIECAFAPLHEPGARRSHKRYASLAQMMRANGARLPTNPTGPKGSLAPWSSCDPGALSWSPWSTPKSVGFARNRRARSERTRSFFIRSVQTGRR